MPQWSYITIPRASAGAKPRWRRLQRFATLPPATARRVDAKDPWWPSPAQSATDLCGLVGHKPNKFNQKNSTKPLVLREGGERSVRRCPVVDKMSDNESEDLPPPDKFGAFLKFGDEIAPVFDDLAIEQAERRKLDAVRIEKTIIVIDRLNVAVDAAIKERIESDQLIEKLNITRLDAMQRKLVHQIETGFQALQDELDEAKERLRIATEKLYQVWADSLRLVVTWRVRCTSLPEPSAGR